MNEEIRDKIFIEHYFRKRIMRKTNNQELLGRIYASKYKKWIVPFLNKNGIEEVPLLISCNTLYQLPDYFRIGGNSFFVADYYLYSFFYDLNYALSDLKRNEFTINIYLKTYIEQAFRTNIDICYSLCKTSATIEDFKETNDYNDHDLSYFLVEFTDIQEAFTFLHESSHFLLEYTDALYNDNEFQKICMCFNKVDRNLNSDFYNESYCDYRAVSYILEKTFCEKFFSRTMYFMAFFSTLIYTYMLRFTMLAQNLNAIEFETYMDNELKMLVFRIGGIYFYIYNFLVLNEFKSDILSLNKAYEKSIHIFKNMSEDLRVSIKLANASGEQNLKSFENINKSEKIDFIKLFLNLL